MSGLKVIPEGERVARTALAELAGLVKLAAVREEGHPVGVPAPCWFHCPCGSRVPAFSGVQTCTCGTSYDGSGWLVRS